MAKYLIQDTTLTNIANAIREKSGTTASIFPDNMPAQIRSIQTTSSDTTGIPDDIVAEANRVANGMISKMGANSLTFIAMSDTHEKSPSDDTNASNLEKISRGNRNAGQAAKLISDKIPLDFFAHLGDFSWGGPATTVEDGVNSICKVREYISDVANDNETFFTPGNHDNLRASYSVNNEYVPHNVLSGLIGDYCYKDFDNKKVRVICLNTADNSYDISYGERVSGEQLQWFCQALDLSAKSNAADWGIVILSHHPLDWCYIKPAANILAAYLAGANYSATHDGVVVSYNFSGKNAAKIIAQFHGHVHGFKVDYINDFRSGTAVPTTVNRLGIPNACYERTNEYGENGKTEWDGIEFGQPEISYEKTDDGTGKNTAFCLVSIDLDNEIIYADCFGAGYDRVISYAVEIPETYSITNNLTNATTSNSISSIIEGSNYTATITASSGYLVNTIKVTMGGTDVTSTAVSGNNISIENVTGDIVITVTTKVDDSDISITNNLTNISNNNSSASIKKGESYMATLTANSGYGISSVVVTMGGTDITSAVYSDGVINIPSVTGNVVITATTYTNLVPTSIGTDGNIFNAGNTSGYMNGTYASGTHYYTDTVCVTTGYIELKEGIQVIYIKGAEWQNISHCRIRFFAYENLGTTSVSYSITGDGTELHDISRYFTMETLGDKYYKLTIISSMAPYLYGKYYAVSLVGTGENLIITHDEPILETSGGSGTEVQFYIITNNLTNATNSNSATSVTSGSAYTATIAAKSGYELKSVTVTMGGSNVTSTVYSNGSINITSVTGNIVITATAEEIVVEPTYTNLVPTMTVVGGTDIFNASDTPGYKNGKYASGANEGTDAACVLTGLMKYNYENGERSPIYIKGAAIDTSKSHCRIIGFANSGDSVGNTATFQSASGSNIPTYFNVETLGTQYYKVTPLETIPTNSYVGWLRFSLIGTGANLIITLNEPIE